MLPQKVKQQLKSTKNLLAFSAGLDSSALFFILLENEIEFDIAIVDYGLREQSKEEVAYAKQLSKKYNKECFVLECEKIDSNFEANARRVRYDFFAKLTQEHSYQILLTAHHLGDRFEWMLMQFCKGAGCAELSSMQTSQEHSNYTLVRPLLHLDKQDLKKYLKNKEIKYFEDESNSDETYKRNRFRKILSPLLDEYKDGIKKSFDYMKEDINDLITDTEIHKINDFAYFYSSNSARSDIYAIDKYLKSLGNIISAQERELIKNESTSVIARKYVVNKHGSYVFIAPYVHQDKLSKEFKEKMRRLKIEPKLRGYLASDLAAVELLSELLA